MKINSQRRNKKLFKFTVRKFAQLKFVELHYFCPMLATKKDAETGCHGGPWGIRASDPGAPSLNCLVTSGTFPGQNPNPKSKSKIQNSVQNPDFFGPGLVILDFGPLCSNSFCEAPGGFGSWILDLGFRILAFWILIHVLDPT